MIELLLNLVSELRLVEKGEEVKAKLADDIASAGIVTSGPLGQGVVDVVGDRLLVEKSILAEFDLPVRVVLSVLRPVLLVVLGSLGGVVLVGLAGLEVGLDLRSELFDGSLDGRPVLGLEGGDEAIGVVSQVLVIGEALGHLVNDGSVLHVFLVDLGEHVRVELTGGRSGNSGVLGSESNESKHFQK